MEDLMEKENTIIQMEQNIPEVFRKIKKMEKEYSVCPMVINMRENLRINL